MAENETNGTAAPAAEPAATPEAAPAAESTAPAAAPAQSGEPAPAVTEPTLLGEASKAAAEEAKAEPAAPEAYEAFTDDAGNAVPLEDYKTFAAAAKESGLSQEKAQKMFTAMRTEADGYVRQRTRELAAQWAEQSRTDSEFGGANFKENLGKIAAAYDQFATPQLKSLLDASGLGNHPEVMRMFYRVGKALAQDTGVKAQEPPAQSHRMFPKSNMVI